MVTLFCGFLKDLDLLLRRNLLFGVRYFDFAYLQFFAVLQCRMFSRILVLNNDFPIEQMEKWRDLFTIFHFLSSRSVLCSPISQACRARAVLPWPDKIVPACITTPNRQTKGGENSWAALLLGPVMSLYAVRWSSLPNPWAWREWERSFEIAFNSSMLSI